MNDIISFCEEFFVFLCMEYWSDFPYVLYKIPDDQIDKQCIVQYAVTIDPSAYPRKSAPPTS